MSTTMETTTATNNRQPSDERKQSPPAFLDLADSAARYGNNLSDVSVRMLKKIEHERQRALQRKMFEDQMRALEQQQAQELLTIETGAGLQHLAASAPTTPPRINAVLSNELSPGLGNTFSPSSVDAEILSKAVGSAVDKRKSVTYAPSVTHSPETLSAAPQVFARPGGAKSMPASRRTSASEHDDDLAGHLQNLTLAGERGALAPQTSPQSILRSAGARYSTGDGLTAYGFNAGMMLDEQLDQEMHNAMRHLPTSDEDKYTNGYSKLSTSSAALDLAPLSQTPPRPSFKPSEWSQYSNGNARGDGVTSRSDRRVVTNPTIALSTGLGDLSAGKIPGTISGRATPLMQQLPQGLGQGISSRRGSPLGLPDGLSITTARSVPTTPLPGAGPNGSYLGKAPSTPLSAEAAATTLNGLLAPQGSSPVELHPSLSRVPSAQFESTSVTFNSVQPGVDEALQVVQAPYDNVYGISGGLDNDGYNDFGYENGHGSQMNGTAGSTALYHHNGTKYGLGMNGRQNGDGKMNGLHGPKHKRGDIDVNRFAGMRLEDLQGEIPSLCKDQHGCRYLQKKLEEGVPEHRDMIFRETFAHFADLMTDPFGNYLCQKLLEYSTDEQRNLICESVAQDLVSISLNMHGTRAVQKMIDFLSTRRQTDLIYNIQIHSIIVALSLHVVVLIKDLNGNHVIQKCLNKLAPEDNQFIYNAVAANCVEVATHRHGCCVLQRCVDHASEHQRIQLVNEITYNALTLVQDPYGNYVVQYILDLNDNRFSDAVIRQFTGNVCALSVQKFSSNVIEKCVRVAEHNTRKMLIGELLNRTRLEKLLRDSYGNYCVQTALDYAEPTQRALLVEGIRPVLPLIRNTPYGKRIQNKLQREQLDSPSSGFYGQQSVANLTLRNPNMSIGAPHSSVHGGHLGDTYSAHGNPYPIQNHGILGQNLHAPLHTMQPHSIEGYVLQTGSGHSPGLTTPHTQSGFSAPSNFTNGYPAMAVGGGMGDPYTRSYGYGM